MPQLGSSGIPVHPLNLGGNVFGWTADRDASFAVLDAYSAGGGDFLDTADSYSFWAGNGNVGGESERLIGEWMRERGNRDRIVVATKVGQLPEHQGTAPATVKAAAEDSLRRLGTDRIDLYYAHIDDQSVPIAEVAAGFDALVQEGKVRAIGLSNFTAERVAEYLAVADAEGLARPVALQPHYNLVHRNDVEASLQPLAVAEDLAILPYWSLASGFLTGKYRTLDSTGDGSPRAQGAAKYATPQGLAIIDALEEIGAAHQASVATTALAWLKAQPAVAGVIASASRPEQLADLLAVATVELSAEELARLTEVSTWNG